MKFKTQVDIGLSVAVGILISAFILCGLYALAEMNVREKAAQSCETYCGDLNIN